ncbi:hypothetical protein D770_15480 [Flammeovirgaceae bacterium 311]|nr:hypothetical protein D770_15480 [Flammeovirgaceae bacterium 311]
MCCKQKEPADGTPAGLPDQSNALEHCKIVSLTPHQPTRQARCQHKSCSRQSGEKPYTAQPIPHSL